MMLIFRVYSLRSSGKVEDSLPVRMTGQMQLHCIANGRRQLEKAGTKCFLALSNAYGKTWTWKIQRGLRIDLQYPNDHRQQELADM